MVMLEYKTSSGAFSVASIQKRSTEARKYTHDEPSKLESISLGSFLSEAFPCNHKTKPHQ